MSLYKKRHRRASAIGTPDAPWEAGRLEYWGGGGGGVKNKPQPHHIRAMSTPEGGDLPSAVERADLQGFTSARAHLSLQ